MLRRCVMALGAAGGSAAVGLRGNVEMDAHVGCVDASDPDAVSEATRHLGKHTSGVTCFSHIFHVSSAGGMCISAYPYRIQQR